MFKSKLINLLKTLSKDELKKFGEYLDSPIFNKREQSCQLYNLIAPHAPDYLDKSLDRHFVFKKLFPQKDQFNRSNLTVAMRHLTDLLEDFFVFIKNENNEYQKTQLLLESFIDRGQSKYFEQLLNKMSSSQTIKAKSTHAYYRQYQISKNQYQYSFVNRQSKHAIDPNKLLQDLDVYYIMCKLKYCCSALNRENIFKGKHQILFLDAIVNDLPKIKHFIEVPLIDLYYACLMMLKEKDNPDHFNSLNNLLKKYTGQIPKKELRNIYILALNYCRSQIQKDQKYYINLLSIYSSMIKDGLLTGSNGYMHHRNFKNIVSLGMKAKQSDWTKIFIDENIDEIDPSIRKSVFHFSLGVWNFYNKQYRDAMLSLILVEYIDIIYHLDSKKLLLSAYYELKETESLFSLADTFKKLVRRNKEMTKKDQKSYLNFINSLMQLHRIRLGGKKSLKDLKEKIENSTENIDSPWLLAKIGELG